MPRPALRSRRRHSAHQDTSRLSSQARYVVSGEVRDLSAEVPSPARHAVPGVTVESDATPGSLHAGSRLSEAGPSARKGSAMGQPVVHFEVIGKDPAGLRGYYGELFGWEFDMSSPVSEAVSEPMNY